MTQDTTYIRQFFEGIRDERGMARNTATRIGTAFLLLLDYLVSIDYPYLRKDIDDSAEGRITFLKGITAHLESLFEGLTFSDILRSEGGTAGSDGTGIHMDAKTGTITTDGLSVRGWMSVAKLVYNMIQVMDQDYQFSGGGDIERVELNQDGTMTLYMHKEKEDRHVSFAEYDILYGKMDEQIEVDGAYYYQTSWMRVCENGITLRDGMQPDEVRVEMWDDTMVPGGRNFFPKAMMTVAKRGNTRDTGRQSYWELSTTDQRITYYWHVDQPILRADNYALCLGILPAILDDAGALPQTRDKNKPSLYVDSLFYANSHHIYFPPRVVKIDRGEWTRTPSATYTGVSGTYVPDGSLTTQQQAVYGPGGIYTTGQVIDEPYHCETHTRNSWLTYRLSPAHSRLTDAEVLTRMLGEWQADKESSRVRHYEGVWEALVEGTAEEPDLGCSDWTLITGPAMTLKMTATKRLLRQRDFRPAGKVATKLGFLLNFGNRDVTSMVRREDVVWTRQSVGADQDQVLADADAAWNTRHRYGDLSLDITSADLPDNWATAREVQFTVTVTIGEMNKSKAIKMHI